MQYLALSALVSVAAASNIIADEYIVQLDTRMSRYSRDAHFKRNNIAPEDIIAEWTIGDDFKGYAFRGNANQKLMIEESAEVTRVTNNEVVWADACVTEEGPSYGLERVTTRDLPTYTNTYTYDDDGGANAISYVLDTGIRVTHEQFAGGRAVWGVDLTGDGEADPNGHGTHVAGTMVGNTVGLARKGTTVAVKVLGDSGSGSWAGIISGFEWVANDCFQRTGGRTCIANMSLGGGRNQSVNDALDAARGQGVMMVASAGNNGGQDACNNSPAGASGAYTVGSTDRNDNRSGFSNVGSCVDIWAPGSSIYSAGMVSDTQYRTLSGTSMSAPHVAGVAQQVLSLNPSFTVDQLEASLDAASTKGAISGLPANTVNNFLFNACQ